MPPVLPIDLEINLKKRARRRLVGAIALVMLMLIILPIILQDRASISQTEAIKISMPEPANELALMPERALDNPSSAPVDIQPAPMDEVKEAPVSDRMINQEVAAIENKTPPTNPLIPENKPAQLNAAGFTIQIGVYSDMANVKQLQDKLAEAGFTSNTEKVATANGEKTRLHAGSFATREQANAALTKLQALKIAGFVKAKI